MYNLITLLDSRNEHNIINQLCVCVKVALSVMSDSLQYFNLNVLFFFLRQFQTSAPGLFISFVWLARGMCVYGMTSQPGTEILSL